MIVTNDYKFSSNINEVIRPVLKFLSFFFLQKDFTSTKLLTANKNKKMCVKTSKGKKLLIRLFAFSVFAWWCFYAFSGFIAFNVFSACKNFL